MKMRRLLYGILGCLLLLEACNKEDEDVKPSYADVNWFQVTDKPGELNQLLYKIYLDTGMPIFVNDTLGEENYATSADGTSMSRLERLNLAYELFGSADTQVSDTIEDPRFVLCKNEAAMIKAAELIRDKVIPRIPKSGDGRAKCYFIVDSLKSRFS